MYPALEVARYVIWYCQQMNYIVSNLKLQKILYFLQAEFLVVRNSPCFNETIEAWTFGPVVPEVYKEYKMFGNAHIPCADSADDFNIEECDRDLINGIIDTCSRYTASQLVDLTHSQSPWINAYEPYQNNPITQESIRDFFIS